MRQFNAFFKGDNLPKSVSSTMLVLLPNVKNANSIHQVIPLRLCNFLHKIISKILNDCLCPLLEKIICPEQTGFVPNKPIHQCITLAHDVVADIHKKVNGGNVILKLDMSKAYDHLSWIFLLRGMASYGFSNKWCDIVYRNFCNCWYSIRLLGKSFGFNKSNIARRQGDPLSPTLLSLVMEILSRKLNDAGKLGVVICLIGHPSMLWRSIICSMGTS